MSDTQRRNGVVVTLERIYEELVKVHEDVTVTKVHVADIRQDVSGHGDRITALERRQWPLPALSILVALGALAASFLRS